MTGTTTDAESLLLQGADVIERITLMLRPALSDLTRIPERSAQAAAIRKDLDAMDAAAAELRRIIAPTKKPR